MSCRSGCFGGENKLQPRTKHAGKQLVEVVIRGKAVVEGYLLSRVSITLQRRPLVSEISPLPSMLMRRPETL